ncbi:MAG: hypothetical protein HPY45_17860 [Anaerolineae bacterium]|nr:hypothetical protein [Anaerolineae bacterium]
MNWKDNYTYTDVSGRRHLRQYVKVAILILVLLIGLFVYAGFKRRAYQAEINPTPVIVATKLALTATATNTVEPSPTPIPPTPTITPDPCPTDPQTQWKFVQAVARLKLNYWRVEPQCVIERSLARTIAWFNLWRYMGWTKQEAADALGFTEIPEHRGWDYMTIPMGSGERTKKVDLLRPNNYPDMRAWFVVQDETYMPGLYLNGCWPTGNETFIVICILREDVLETKTPMVFQVEGKLSTLNSDEIIYQNTYYFGYLRQEHYWMIIGRDSERPQPPASWEQALKNREGTLFIFGGRFWSPKWVEEAYGLRPKDLPDDWQQYTDPKYKDELVGIIKAYWEEHKQK